MSKNVLIKRIATAALAVIMVLGIFPVQAFADGAEDAESPAVTEAFDAAAETVETEETAETAETETAEVETEAEEKAELTEAEDAAEENTQSEEPAAETAEEAAPAAETTEAEEATTEAEEISETAEATGTEAESAETEEISEAAESSEEAAPAAETSEENAELAAETAENEIAEETESEELSESTEAAEADQNAEIASENAEDTEISETAENAEAEQEAAENAQPESTEAEAEAKTEEKVTIDTVLYANDDIYLTGIMPKDGIVEVIPVSIEIEGQNVIAAYDITIYENEANKALGICWQPEDGSIVVHIKDEVLSSESNNVEIYHIPEEDAEPEHVGTAVAKDSEVEFEAASFSIYAIVEGQNGNNARIAYRFWYFDGATGRYELIDTQYFRFRDIHPVSGNPLYIYDPGCPEALSKEEFTALFEGWYVGSVSGGSEGTVDFEDASSEVTIKSLNEQLSAMAEDDYVEGMVTDLVAKIRSVYYVLFADVNPANILRTELVPQSVGTFTVPSDLVLTKYEDKLSAWVNYDDPSERFIPGESYSVSSNMTLVPAIAGGYWLIFSDNDNIVNAEGKTVSGGASYTPSSFYMGEGAADAKATEKPADPTWSGYEFAGWFEDADCTVPFEFGGYLDKDTTVYAGWTPNEASYRIITWIQKETDAVDADDSEKTYSLGGATEPISAVTGEIISLDSCIEAAEELFRQAVPADERSFYVYNSSLSESTSSAVMVENDGSTVVNAYYDRRPVTINFSGNLYFYQETEETDGALYGDLDGEFVILDKDGEDLSYSVAEISYEIYEGDRYTETSSTSNDPQKYYLKNGVMTEIYSNGYSWYSKKSTNWWGGESYSNRVSNPGTIYEMTEETSGTQYTESGKELVFEDGSFKYATGTKLVSVSYTGKTYKKVTQNGLTITGLYGSLIASGQWPVAINGSSEYWWTFKNTSGGNTTLNAPWNSYTIASSASSDQIASLTWNLTRGNAAQTGQMIYYIGEDVNGSYSILLAQTSRSSNASLNVSSEKFYGFTTAYWTYKGARTELDGKSTTITSSYFSSENPLYIYYAREKFDLTFYTNNEANDISVVNGVAFEKSLEEYANYSHGKGQAGYYFAGWYKDPGFTEPFDFSSIMPHSDTTVYGCWKMERIRVVVVPGANNVSLGSQSLSFRLDYDEVIDGGLLEAASRAGYILDGWYTDPDFTNKWLFTTPVNSDVDGVDMTYQTAAKWTAARVSYGDDSADQSNVRGILVLYAKWLINTSVSGVSVEYDAGSAAICDAFGTLTTKIPVDTLFYQVGSEAVVGSAPSGYNKLSVFTGWQMVDGNGCAVGELMAPGSTIVLTDSEEDAFSIIKDEAGKVIRKTVMLKAVYTAAEGSESRYTKVTYHGNTFEETLFGGQTAVMQGKTRDGAEALYISSDELVNSTLVLPGEDSFYLAGYALKGWSFKKGSSQNIAFGLSAVVAADNLKVDEENDESNTLYAVWEKKTYSVTVKQVIESGVEESTFSYTVSAGEQGAALSEQAMTLSGNQSAAAASGLYLYDLSGSVFAVSAPKISEDASWTVRVNAVVTKDNGSTEVINAEEDGTYRVLGDTEITFTYSPKVKVNLVNKSLEDGIVITGALIRLTPVEYDYDAHVWNLSGSTVDVRMESENTIWLQTGTYMVEQIEAPKEYLPLTAAFFMTVDQEGGISLKMRDLSSVSAQMAETSGENGVVIYSSRVLVAPTGISFAEQPFIFMLAAGMLMFAAGVVIRKTRREEEE